MEKPVVLADSEGIRYLESSPVRAAAEKGFSLIEVLFAAGLISFLLAGTAELLLTSIEIDRSSERTVNLAGVLSSEIDEFKAKPFTAAELEPGAGEIVIRPDPEGPGVVVAWSVTAVSENLKKVSFSLIREGVSRKPMEAVLLITRELAGT
ncbi:MAG: type II secretion system protein [Candidatus Aminicenantes bacterium]|nr:type II secretion system protein [Candidatus Aminicenantes bacterium]